MAGPPSVAAVIAIAILLTGPANWLVRQRLITLRSVPKGGVEGAGKWIGILEGLLIFLLVLGDEAGGRRASR